LIRAAERLRNLKSTAINYSPARWKNTAGSCWHPSWKYVLNYETKWMNRDQIVSATYEAGRQMNLIKGEFGVLDGEVVDATDRRIARAVELMAKIDQIVQTVHDPGRTTAIPERFEAPGR
jgi:hypothetical protein